MGSYHFGWLCQNINEELGLQ